MTLHLRAILALTAACVGWAFSFPLLKALLAHQGPASAWLTLQSQLMRYLGAGAVLLGIAWWRSRRLPTRQEWLQAAVCAGAAATGLFLQIDALNHTAASTVGFLTQLYVVLLPLAAGVAARRWPSPLVIISVLLAFAGVALLSGVSPDDLRPGLGEMMTLAASVAFMVQILALGARRWAGNDGLQVTWAMFAVMALLTAPFVALMGPGLPGLPACYADAPSIITIVVVTALCTCMPYALMTVWQRHVSETEAGVIYCTEAAFTAALCLVLPGLLGRWMGIPYGNESVTWPMLVGGGLILAGCLLVQVKPKTGNAAGAGP